MTADTRDVYVRTYDLPESTVIAAGAVLWRLGSSAGAGGGQVEIGLVHRPKYDDWSLPKGKLDPGEHLLTCAVREVYEETGHRITLGLPLPTQHYPVEAGAKAVYYWAALADPAAPPWPGTAEIDELQFRSVPDAVAQLTRPQDRVLVADFATHLETIMAERAVSAVRTGRSAMIDSGTPAPTVPLVVVRHGKAVARSHWEGDDALRPLHPRGLGQANALGGLLGHFGTARVVSSPSTRCLQTLAPYLRAQENPGDASTLTTTGPATGSATVPLELDPDLAETGDRSKVPGLVRTLVEDSVAYGLPTALCTHRPVLPDVFAALGLPALALKPGDFVVVQHRAGDDGRPVVVSVEHHRS